MSIATVVLAAGGSTRMGSPKQLLEYGGQALVRCAALVALDSHLGPVAVVVGSEAESTARALDGLEVIVVVNGDWGTGMGSSIRVGLSRFSSDSEITAVIITLADQPRVDAPLLIRLAREHKSDRAVACGYSGSVGVPALFPRALFPRLELIPAASGAKPLLTALGPELTVIDFPGAATDIDTPEDYRRLKSEP